MKLSAWCVIQIVLASFEAILCTFYCIRLIARFYLGRGRDTIDTIRQLFSTKKIAVWDFSFFFFFYFERTSSVLKASEIHQALKLGQNPTKKKKKKSYESVSKLK